MNSRVESEGIFAFLRRRGAGILKGLESMRVPGTWQLRCGAFLARERRTFARIIGSRQAGAPCEKRASGGQIIRSVDQRP